MLGDGRPARRRPGRAATSDTSLLDLFATPEQREVIDRLTGVMSLLEGHADVVMDGVGPEVIPSRRRDPGASSTGAARAPAPSTGCCAGCSGSTPRWRSTATAPRFVRGVVDEVGMDGFNAVWAEPANLPVQGRDRRPRTPGCAACTADRCRRMTARPGGRRGPPRRTPRRSPTSPRSRSCWSPAPAAPTRWRCWPPPSSRAAPGGRHVVGVTVDHGLQDGSAEHAARVVAADGRPRRRPRRSASGCEVDAPRPGPEAAAREARYAVLGRGRASASAPRRCCSGTPSTTRPRPCCSGWPGARAAARWPGMRRGFGRSFRRPLLDVTRAQTEAACRAEGIEFWDGPAQRATPASPGPGCGTGCCRCSRPSSAPGSPAALARTADLLREDLDALDELADALARADLDGPGGLDVVGLAALPPAPCVARVLRLRRAGRRVPRRPSCSTVHVAGARRPGRRAGRAGARQAGPAARPRDGVPRGRPA